jgi:D-lactate dehydrogenase
MLLRCAFLKIAFFEVQNWERPFLEKGLANFDVRMVKEALDEANVDQAKDFEVVSVFIYSNVNKSTIDKLTKARLIATRSTGFDHIDLQDCKSRGILVCNVPFYGEVTVAEHTFALILSLSRMIHDSYQRTRQGDFTCEGVRGFDLNGKTLGVLGTGRIGSKVIEIAKGFKMKVLAFDRFPNWNLADTLGFEYTEWPDLLAQSDIVTLHLPFNKDTYHFLNKDTISRMKKSAIIINTARGGLIDTQALTEALLNGHLGGAGLDVLEEEALIREEAQLLLDNVPRERLATMLRAHILLTFKNVIITPHCAFNSKESLERLVNATIENIKVFIDGKPQNLVRQLSF